MAVVLDWAQWALLIFIVALTFVIVLLILVRVVFPSMARKRRSMLASGRAWIDDQAYNQIQAGKGLANFLEREGIDASEALILLERAEGKYEIRRFGEALRLAKEAAELLAKERKKIRMATASAGAGPVGRPVEEKEPEPAPYRDVARRVGDPEVDHAPTAATPGLKPSAPLASGSGGPPNMTVDEPVEQGEEAEEGTLVAERAKRPKDYMEARFMLTALQDDLGASSPEKQQTPEFKEARDWAEKSQASYVRKDYTESLRLAMRARRRLGGAGISTISVGAGTVVEAPPDQPSATALRSSAPPLTATSTLSASPVGALPALGPKMACGRCGSVNSPGDRFCRRCGALLAQPNCPRCKRPVEPDDKFCHGCGSPLAA